MSAWIENGEKPTLKIKFWNRYGVKVVLPSPNPFEFYSLRDELIYSPTSPQVLVEVDVGEGREWTFSLVDLGLSDVIGEGLVVKMSIIEPRDEIYVVLSSGKR